MALITEIDYANSNGGGDFMEVVIEAGENPADFSVAVYNNHMGNLVQFETVNLGGLIPVVTYPNGDQLFILATTNTGIPGANPVFTERAGTDFYFNGGNASRADEHAHVALVDITLPQPSGVIDFYSMNVNAGTISPTIGLAAGATSTNLPNVGQNSYNFARTTGANFTQGDQYNIAQNAGDTVCFSQGTLIATDRGDIAVEHLRQGDMVLTLDNGFQPVIWIGSQFAAMRTAPKPIKIPAGALANTEPLVVSGQHRILLTHEQCSEIPVGQQYFASAKHLVGWRGVAYSAHRYITYYHILCAQHQIVRANGAFAESFYPGPVALQSLSTHSRDQIASYYPGLVGGDTVYGPLARPTLKKKDIWRLIESEIAAELDSIDIKDILMHG